MQKFAQSRAMVDAIAGVRALLKWESLRADNFVFRLHYKVSFAFLLVCSFIVTAKQYVGDPIDCVTSAAVEKLIDQYCWIHSTFTVTRVDKFGRYTYYASDELDDNSIHLNGHGLSPVALAPNRRNPNPIGGAGVGGGGASRVGHGHGHGGYPGIHGVGTRPGERKLYHRYYQWVCFVLFGQAILFYIPRYIWKICDGGRLKLLVSGLQLHTFNAHLQNVRREQITSYFINHKGHWGYYAYRFYICELLNLLNTVGQIVLMDSFLGNAFSTFGLSIISVTTDDDPYQRTDPLAIIFPKVTKCTFNAHGIGGSIVNHDAICVLSVNNINEKIYIFLWFWFIFLLLVSLLALCYRILTILSWRLRFIILNLNYGSAHTTAQLRTIVFLLSSSDWFVLYQISKNINSTLFIGIIRDLDEKIGSGKAKSNSVTSV